MKRIYSIVIALALIASMIQAPSVFASGNDDVLPTSMTDVNHAFVLFAPDTESMESTGNNLCLNLLSSSMPANGTNITKAPYTNNGTQWFKHLYYVIGSTVYVAWATYNNSAYSINCNRSNSVGSYVNVYKISTNPRGDLNIHSPKCFDPNHSPHFLAAPPRLSQTSIMCILKTGESTGYTNNTYLIWRAIGYSPTYNQHIFIYDKTINTTFYDYCCLHDGVTYHIVPA